MTYTERYNAIIHYFQRHPVDKKKIYCERHHIIPRACGGSNKKENLVNLPAAWHYRVHCYLPFVMQEQNNQDGYFKMIYAWQRCLNSTKNKLDLMNINKECLEYKTLREAQRNLQSIRSKEFHRKNPDYIKGSKNPMTNIHWWKDPNDKTKSLCIRDGNSIPEGWIKGHWNNENLRVTHITYCSYCGAEKGKCLHPEICNRPKMILGIKKIFPYSQSIFGSEKFYEWFFSIMKQVKRWYCEENLSMLDIAKKLNYKKKSYSSLYSCIGRLLLIQGIKLASFKEAAIRNKSKYYIQCEH